MIANDFGEKYSLYENMAVWEVSSMEDFFSSHSNMKDIFEKEYGSPYSKGNEDKFSEGDISVIERLLGSFGDKYFFVFSNSDNNHTILKKLQDNKIINFGIDIHVLNPKKIFILEMDKTKDLQKYDH